MATQTSYSERMGPPTPGTLAGNAESDRVSSGLCETVAGIGFGLAVSQGAESDGGVILGGTLAGLRGCSVKDVTLPASNEDKYLPPNEMGVLQGGDIWVAPNAAVNAGDSVYFVAATGVWSNSATTPSTALGPVKGARWKTSCLANGVAILELPHYYQK